MNDEIIIDDFTKELRVLEENTNKKRKIKALCR